MTTTSLLSALSVDGSMAAINVRSVTASTRHLIQVYQVSDSSTTLQLTLTHTSSLPLCQLVFVGNKSVLGLLGTKEVVVWDLDRGVVAVTMVASEDQTFRAIAANQDDDNNQDGPSSEQYYYVLVQNGPKLLVQEYQGSNNKMVRKIKSGHLDGTEANDNNVGDETSHLLTASLVITNSRVVVRTIEEGIRIMDKDSGKKTGKIKMKSNSSGTSMQSSLASYVAMNTCVNHPNILGAIQENGSATLYDMTTTTELAHVPPPSKGSQTVSGGGGTFALQLVSRRNNNGNGAQMYSLLFDDHLYSITTTTPSGTATSSSSSNSKNSFSITKLSQLVCDNPVALFLRSNHKVLAMMYQRSLSECNVEWIDLNDDDSDLPSLFKLGDTPKGGLEQSKDATSRREKRKPVATKVLGPGQAGIEALPATKKMKKADDEDDDDEEKEEEDNDAVDKKEKMKKYDIDDSDAEADRDGDAGNDDDNDVIDGDDDGNDEGDYEGKHISIAERLQQMTDALEAEEEDEDDAENDDEDMDDGSEGEGSEKKSTRIRFKPKGATTESLKEILTQALQSSDESLLELALTVRDAKIIATSLRELDDALLVTLLGKLTVRLASTPLRAESLSIWLSHCLKYGSYQPEHLAALRNLLYERIESFSDLLRLEGRLSMLVATE